jgi:recombination protein RecA
MAKVKEEKKVTKKVDLLEGVAESLSKSMAKKFKNSSSYGWTNIDDDGVIKSYVSTGCTELDLAVSNIANGGLPCGRLTILYGPEQSGKSLIVAHLLANTQKKGGVAMFADAEVAYHAEYFKAVGVDASNKDYWMYTHNNKLEELLTWIEDGIAYIRERDANIPITVALDSFAACVTEGEMSGDFSKKGYNTDKSIIITSALNRLITMIWEQNVCFVITNQVRSKMNAQAFEDPWRMPGGQALPHYASVIIRLRKSKSISIVNKFGVKREVGREATATTEKNRLTGPHIRVSFNIYYDRGIDDYLSMVKNMGVYKIGNVKAGWITYTHDGVEYKENGAKAFSNILRKNPEVFEAIKEEFSTKYITHYKMTDADFENEIIESKMVDDEDDTEDDDQL